MAKFELKFIDCINDEDFIKTEMYNIGDIHVGNVISITGVQEENAFTIYLDKSTAIKFAKTLRTEINKITESDVNNG